MPASVRRVSPLATASAAARFTAVDAALVARKARDAAGNARLREIHRFHRDDAETLQRMLNALQPGTYIRPHRHQYPPKAEIFVPLTGVLGFVAFDDDGNFGPGDCLLLDREQGALAVDVSAGTWHTVLALAPDTVALECKPGPYAPALDKDFAPWAPAEGRPEARAFLRAVETRLREVLGLAPLGW